MGDFVVIYVPTDDVLFAFAYIICHARFHWVELESKTPTAMTDGISITGVIDAREERDNMSADISNAFIQAEVPKGKDTHTKIIMKISGKLVDMLVAIAPETHAQYIVYKNKKKVLYIQVLRTL